MFAEAAIRITGTPAIYTMASDAGTTVTRLFCNRCGSPLFGKNSGMPGFMTVMMGTLDSSEGLSPQVAIFTRTRRSWDALDPSIESFETQPDWKPDSGKQ
jgi:hypothetical protein